MAPDREVPFHEVLCRGPSKCGTFVSVRPLKACPKCGSTRVTVRSPEARRGPADAPRSPKD
ncbi:MAG: hypothetical protein A3K65_01150 [Euryarchaeota archaeon RBG_16_68_12]|nr:MAG: hypothetical protein A3K65_01150 [Euryarchaeota archaeon RBG_16_68_12]